MATISTIEQLEALYPGIAHIAPATRGKETAVINDAYRQLIEAAPFFAIASIGPEGMDCSPRGDGPGSIRILDSNTIAFADRRGNNRLDTLRNIVSDPGVALLFLIPGWNECLRINGQARITDDPDMLEEFAVNGKLPASAIVVTIDTMYFQCARALRRSALWDPASQAGARSLPTAGQLVKSVIDNFNAVDYDGSLQERQEKTLY